MAALLLLNVYKTFLLERAEQKNKGGVLPCGNPLTRRAHQRYGRPLLSGQWGRIKNGLHFDPSQGRNGSHQNVLQDGNTSHEKTSPEMGMGFSSAGRDRGSVHEVKPLSDFELNQGDLAAFDRG